MEVISEFTIPFLTLHSKLRSVIKIRNFYELLKAFIFHIIVIRFILTKPHAWKESGTYTHSKKEKKEGGTEYLLCIKPKPWTGSLESAIFLIFHPANPWGPL